MKAIKGLKILCIAFFPTVATDEMSEGPCNYDLQLSGHIQNSLSHNSHTVHQRKASHITTRTLQLK